MNRSPGMNGFLAFRIRMLFLSGLTEKLASLSFLKGTLDRSSFWSLMRSFIVKVTATTAVFSWKGAKVFSLPNNSRPWACYWGNSNFCAPTKAISSTSKKSGNTIALGTTSCSAMTSTFRCPDSSGAILWTVRGAIPRSGNESKPDP